MLPKYFVKKNFLDGNFSSLNPDTDYIILKIINVDPQRWLFKIFLT